MPVAGRPILSACIAFPQRGAWTASLVYSANPGDEPLSGELRGRDAIELDGGIVLTGTILDEQSGVYAGRGGIHVVGGQNQLWTALPAKEYSGTTSLRVVLEDLARETGETMADATALWSRTVPRWTRPAGTMAQTLDAILGALGGAWRVLDDGTIWVGEDTWETQYLDSSDVIQDQLSGPGCLVVATESPHLRAGRTLEGRQVSHVTHEITSRTIRSTVYLGESRDLAAQVRRLVRDTLRTELAAAAVYAAEVVSEDSNSTVEVRPDDPTLPEMAGVPIRRPWPGCKPTLSSGDRVLVGFEGGDLTKPFAVGSEYANPQEVILDRSGADKGVARIDDAVRSGRLHFAPGTPGAPGIPGKLYYLPEGATSPGQWTELTGAPAPTPPLTLNDGVAVDGLILEGSSRIKA